MIRLRRPRHDRVTLRCERFRKRQDDQRTEWIRQGAYARGTRDGAADERERWTKVVDADRHGDTFVVCPGGKPKHPIVRVAVDGHIFEIEAEQHRCGLRAPNPWSPELQIASWLWRPVR